VKQPTYIQRALPVTIIGLILIVAPAGGCAFRKPLLKWHLTLEVDPTVADRDAVVLKTVKVLENRLHAWGVKNFRLTPQHAGRILLDMSAESDPERLKSLITTGGKLELMHVISPPSPAPVQTFPTKDEAIASLKSDGSIPADRRVLPYSERDDPPASAVDIPKIFKWVVVESPAIVDGSSIRNASAVLSRGDNYEIPFSLDKPGGEKVGAWTRANVNEYLSVVLNDKVKSIAFIKSQITDSGVISGSFTKAMAEDLALVLNSGALPATIKIADERIDK